MVGAVAGLGTLVLLAGCTGEGVAGVSVSPSADAGAAEVSAAPTSITPPATAAEVNPVELAEDFPEAQSVEDVAGATAFATRFLSSYHDIVGEAPALFAALTTADCDFCSGVKDHYEQVASENAELSGGAIEARAVDSKSGLQQDGTWAIEFEVDVEDLVRTSSDGASEVIDDGGPGLATVILIYEDHWRVQYVGAERT